MTLFIPLCRTNIAPKSMSFLGPEIWNKVSSNIKTGVTTSPFIHCLKKEILSKLQVWAIFFITITIIFFFNFLKADFFTTFLCVYDSRGTLMEKEAF